MTVSSELIDEVVQIVMRELSLLPADGTAAPNSAAGAVNLPHRVITESVLAGENTSDRTIKLATGAVITPSGKDYIRRHGIIVSNESNTPPNNSIDGVVLVVGDTKRVSAPAASAGWTVARATGNFDAANQVAQRRHHQPAVCCSAQPSIIACLVNRNTQRRAAVITSQTCLSELLREMNPDTVCLSTAGWSFAELLRMLKQLSERGRAVPADWKELV